MAQDEDRLMEILSDTAEDTLQSYLEKRISARVKFLRQRQEELSREMAAIKAELDIIQQYATGSAEGPSVQEVLSRLLKSDERPGGSS